MWDDEGGSTVKIVFVLCAFALLAAPASAKPPEGYTPSPDESAWFKSLHQSNGTPCCSEQTDCRKVPAANIRSNGPNWQFKATREIYGIGNGDDEWHDIPPEKIQHSHAAMQNPTGEWVICFVLNLEDHTNYMGLQLSGVVCAFEPAGT